MATRITEILAEHAAPALTISRIRWNAQLDPLLAATLDIQDRILVSFNGVTQDSRIVGITHELTGAGWETELELATSQPVKV
jgi:hypothetical protein